MKSKIKVVILIIIISLITIIIVGINISGDSKRKWSKYSELYNESETDVYVSKGSGDTVTIVGNVAEDSERVVEYMSTKGYIVVFEKMTLDTIGEGEVPEIVSEYNVDEWYEMTTQDGIVYAIIINDEIILSIDWMYIGG